jgi:putative photosynthetic complex assembly protein
MSVRIGVHDRTVSAGSDASHPQAFSDHLPPDPIPKPLLYGAAALMCLALSAAMFGTPERFNDPAKLRPAVAQQKSLLFVDQPGGHIAVLDGASRATISTYGPDDGGFLRTVLRGLARERQLAGFGPEQQFLLYRAATDNRLIIEDPTTGKVIGLDAFGGDNAKVFAALLVKK